MNNIHWSTGWGFAGQIIVLAVLVALLLAFYVRQASRLGVWLHRKDVEQQLTGQMARERKARIDAWLTVEEEKYVDEVEARYLTDYGDVITRDDAEPFHLQDEQPTRPAA